MKNNIAFYNTLNYKLGVSLTIAIFFYVFIVFFLPFGVANYNPNHQYTFDFFLEIFYFFIPMLIFSLLNEMVLKPVVIKTISFQKIVFWSVWTLLLLSTVVYITYNILGNWHDFRLSSYLEFLLQVPVVLLFPLVGTFFFFKYRSLQNEIEYILTTKEGTIETNQLVEFKGQGSKDQITLSLANFLYGKSQDNYVELYYTENDQLKKFLMRSSLSNLIDSINNLVIVRCHRSYIVNLMHVSAVKGKSNNMTLSVDPLDGPIPISKSYEKTTIESLHKIKNFG